jgi:DNA polymerase
MKSYQNLVLLQNLYRLKAMGYEYIDHFNINEKTTYEKPISLEELSANINSCHLCDLSKSRSQSMSGFGDANAALMIVDYTVSQNQDNENSYYAGRSGEILKNMIERVIKIDINKIFLTHCVKCKTLNTNKPSPSEFNSCKNYLYSQIEFIKPKVIVTLGEDAYSHLSGNKDNFENVRGHVISFRGARLIPIYHPQFLLRNPESKKITMSDLNTIKHSLES